MKNPEVKIGKSKFDVGDLVWFEGKPRKITGLFPHGSEWAYRFDGYENGVFENILAKDGEETFWHQLNDGQRKFFETVMANRLPGIKGYKTVKSEALETIAKMTEDGFFDVV